MTTGTTAPEFSVIIPTLNEESGIADCLDAVPGLGDAVEVIVADGGSHDETLEIVRTRTGAKWLTCSPGRAVQMNAGARLAKGEILIFLHADTFLPNDALARIRQALDLPGTVAGSFRLRFRPATPLLRVFGWMSSWNLPLTTYGDQAYFLRRNRFNQAAGFREDLPICEDIDFQRRLRRLGRWTKIQDPVTTSSRRFLRNGPLKQQLLNLLVVGCFLAGIDPHRLHRWYYGRPKA